jgi:hypothetical protein
MSLFLSLTVPAGCPCSARISTGVSRSHRRRSRAARWLGASVLALTMASMANPAQAWKPFTHVALGEVALSDALDDGKVTIYRTIYEEAERLDEVIGEYAVDPLTLKGLREAHGQFRAGTMGPDVYPDPATGQTLIHPNTNPFGGSDAWLRRMWRISETEAYRTPQVRAFVVGYLSHALGDMYAHTMINHFTGGEFYIGENALRHVLIEEYVNRRTKLFITATAPRELYDAEDLSIHGVAPFIYEALVFSKTEDAQPVGELYDHLLNSASRDWDDVAWLPPTALFQWVRKELDAQIIEPKSAQLEAERKEIERQACTPRSQGCLDLVWAKMKELKLDITGLAINHFAAQRNAIEFGLRDMIAVSHAAAKAYLGVHPRDADPERLQQAVESWVRRDAARMFGIPTLDDLIRAIGAEHAKEVLERIASLFEILPNPLREAGLYAARQGAQSATDYFVYNKTGKTLTDIKKLADNPPRAFAEVLGQNALQQIPQGLDAPVPITLESFNRDVLGLKDKGWNTPAEFYEIDKFAAAYNTVTMTKLAMLGQPELRRLMSDLGVDDVQLEQPNVMLGFLSTLDGDNEWHKNADRFAFGASNKAQVAYRNMFMKQTGERPPVHGDCTDLSGTWLASVEKPKAVEWTFEQNAQDPRHYQIRDAETGAEGRAVLNRPRLTVAWGPVTAIDTGHVTWNMNWACNVAKGDKISELNTATGEMLSRDFNGVLMLQSRPDERAAPEAVTHRPTQPYAPPPSPIPVERVPPSPAAPPTGGVDGGGLGAGGINDLLRGN